MLAQSELLWYMATMLTVPEAARRTKRSPETVRQWIRSGRLEASRIGPQYLIDEKDLARLARDTTLPLATSWQGTATGERMPDVVAAIRSSRRARRLADC